VIDREGETMNRQVQTKANLESLIHTLAGKDGLAREKARHSLVRAGEPAVPLLVRALQESPVDQVRWEAAKALGMMRDVRAIPVLVQALDDHDADVAWLAAEALQKFKKAAWPALLHALIQYGAESAALRQGAHHVFRRQRAEEFEDLIAALLKALETETLPEATTTAAHEILERMETQAEEGSRRRLPLRRPAQGTP
jgi:HEAT repeat protein